MTNAIFAVTLAATLLDVSVQRVNDRRSAGHFSQLDITLELPKIKSADVAASRVLVSAATDETGRDLIDRENQAEPQLITNLTSGREPDANATVSVTLENPARAATKVKEVRGEIELYMPSKDPNSTAEIAKFLSYSGKPLSHKALKANAIEIAVVSPAQLAAEKKKFADEKRKEYQEIGYEGEALEETVRSLLEYRWSVEANDVVLRVKDPQQRIQEVVYVDGKGEVKRVSMREDEGLTLLSTWEGPPQPDWKLRISMRTNKSTVRHAFVLKDVPLP